MYTNMHAYAFYIRRNKVSEEARKRWPGNDIPIFRNNKDNQAELDKLVDSLEDCVLPYFNREQIRRHILDTLTERRRNIKRGYNYDDVS